jgi:cellulose synthase/poly-beta-1,6-N-acetylglucosamine synthase-like glycosyltransferase
MFYSIILPTFGRPEEVSAFLESIGKQQYKDFEVIMVDGSHDNVLHPVVDRFRERTALSYFHEKGLGASESRNLGCEKAKGDFVVFIDSDCIVPDDYLLKVEHFLQDHKHVDAFGGPDAAAKDFTIQQKAVNYAMTSFLTTGGIRGKKTHVGKFQLRGFNMGIRKEVFFKVGGYSGMQVAEDIDLSMRLIKAGYTTALVSEAFVYHRRKTSLKLFFRQMYFHGKGRIDLHLRHGDALKPVHLLPSFFVLFILAGIASVFIHKFIALGFAAILALYILALFIDATAQYKSLSAGIASVIASLEMHIAYGLGVIRNIIVRMLLGKGTDSVKAEELKK